MPRTLLLALALLPAALGAQAADPAASRARLQRELDAKSFAAVTRVVDDASRRGLPGEALLNKALEGVMRRRPASVVVVAVERLAQRLDSARTALAPATPAELQAGAEALGKGVPPATLKAFRALRPNASLHVPLGVLTQLVASNVPVPRASAQVLELLRRDTRETQLIALGDDVQKEIAVGTDPEKALDVRVHGILSGSGGTAASPTNTPAELQAGGGNFDNRNNTPGTRSSSTRPPRRP